MLKYFFLSMTVALSLLLAGNVVAQSPQGKAVTISYTWNRIPGGGSNQVAIWIENNKGEYVTTVYVTRWTAAGGYVRRPLSLSEWVEKSNWKAATQEQIDAVSGTTPQAGKQEVIWKGIDMAGKPVPAGTYVVRMEANILNEKKMFFRGEITLGGADQKTNGAITYSEPGLESGNQLFRDVLVEYK